MVTQKCKRYHGPWSEGGKRQTKPNRLLPASPWQNGRGSGHTRQIFPALTSRLDHDPGYGKGGRQRGRQRVSRIQSQNEMRSPSAVREEASAKSRTGPSRRFVSMMSFSPLILDRNRTGLWSPSRQDSLLHSLKPTGRYDYWSNLLGWRT
jgi:hypothetical protein